MLSAEGIGKNIEKAIENALIELKASREDVDIKILNEGGLFKKAKVLVTISDDAKEKYEKRRKFVEEEKEEEKKSINETSQENKEVSLNEEEIEPSLDTISSKNELNEEEKSYHEKVEKNIDPMEFLKGLFEKAGKTVEINVKDDDKYITYSVIGEDLGDMIGHRGECFYAISRLLSVVCGKQDKKILLDIGGFREKRADSLTELAKRMASKVIKTGRYVKLDPMNPSDRRIIHTALQDDDRVTTLSKGTEPHRSVMIFPKESE